MNVTERIRDLENDFLFVSRELQLTTNLVRKCEDALRDAKATLENTQHRYDIATEKLREAHREKDHTT
jgi:chromosome segregation ATPase